MDSEELKERFVKLRPLYEELIAKAESILVEALKKNDVKIHSLESRIKSFDNFYNKVVRSLIKEDPFTAISDIAGIRIVCLYRHDLEKISYIIDEEFNVLHFDSSNGGSSEDLAYVSAHYVISLPEKHKVTHYDEIRHLQCEVQVRTILMHAWSLVSHQLNYKGEEAMPPEIEENSTH